MESDLPVHAAPVQITRRTFVKRTSEMTLGSVLGLGILPSITRKLHAIDGSEISPADNQWEGPPDGPFMQAHRDGTGYP
jgi:hypothetical protein